MKRVRFTYFLLPLLLSAGVTACQNAGGAQPPSSGLSSAMAGQEEEETPTAVISPSSESENRLRAAVLDHLLSDAADAEGQTDDALLTRQWGKAGDIRTRLSFYLPGGVDSARLSCSFSFPGESDPWAYAVEESGDITTAPHTQEYELVTSPSGNTAIRNPYTITFSLGQSPDVITVTGEGDLAGDYYPLDIYEMPDVFERYLTDVELCWYPTEDLWLLRNQIYAAHGRTFESEELNQYFGSKPWYRGRLSPQEFPEEELTGWEKANIALIKQLEEIPHSERSRIDGFSCAPEDLKPAPYLSLLDPDREAGLYADLTAAEDRGAFFAAQGAVSLPLTISPKELEAVRQGRDAELVLNEVTGETWILSARTNPDHPAEQGYVFYKKGTTPAGFDDDIHFRADYKSGLYELWQASDDTVMKTVYEGDIYLLKGAVTGAYVSLTSASLMQRVICFPEPGQTEAGEADRDVAGNCLRHNGRGYFTAVYSLGD